MERRGSYLGRPPAEFVVQVVLQIPARSQVQVGSEEISLGTKVNLPLLARRARSGRLTP